MENAMDGEELPYPGFSYVVNTDIYPIALTPEDQAIFKARCGSVPHDLYAFADFLDLIVMFSRTSCTGVKPAMKNLAVFLKYS